MNTQTYRVAIVAILFLLNTIRCVSQSDPGTLGLMHQWTFDDGTAKDAVATNQVNGTLMGGATIANKALVLSAQGQYLSFSGSALALNSYTAIAQEIWFAPSVGANAGFAHLAYFGRTVNTQGNNFLFVMPARGDNKSRTAISDGDLSRQVVANGPEYDDCALHQFVSVVRADSLFFYIDGKLVDKVKNTVPLSGISNSLAYLGKSGFTSDPTWIGSISKYSIYNKSLSPAEVLFLFKTGAENNPAIITSASSLIFNQPQTQKLAVWARNLGQNITITAPANFSLSATSLANNVNGDSLSITYTGTSNTSGYVYLISGNVRDSVLVKGIIDPSISVSKKRIVLDEYNPATSFTVSGYNLKSDISLTAPAGISLSSQSLAAQASGAEVTITYIGTGNSSGSILLSSGNTKTEIAVFARKNSECFVPLYPENIITDPTLNFDASGTGRTSINTNPDYVYCGSASGLAAENGSIVRDLGGKLKPSTTYRVRAMVFKNHARIKPGDMGCVTYTLAMDSATYPDKYRLIKIAMDSACAYYSKYTPFVKDIYVYYNEGIPTAQANNLGSIGFGANTTYMWVGTAIHEMAHYFGSGTTATWKSLMSSGVWAGKAGADFLKNLSGETLKGDQAHFWPLGINYKTEITNLGSQAAQRTALINSVKLIKAMLVDDCKFAIYNTSTGVGITGHDPASAGIYQEVSLSNTWETVDFTFTTGTSTGTNPSIYFKSDQGYIDNWELYEVKDERTVSITLSAGWNLVSIPIAFVDMSVRKVFPNATEVKNQSRFYNASQQDIFNSLQTIESAQGYLVYNSIDETIQLKGYELSNKVIHVAGNQGGWGLLGCPYQISTPFSTDFNSTNCSIIKDFDGYWKPDGTTNSIQNLEPGKAYFIK